MALSFSNLTGSANAALNSKKSDLSTLNLNGVGLPQVPGITNRNVLPPALQAQPSSKPAATPVQPAAASSPGSYKGVAITPGSDAETAAQLARIDGTGATSIAAPVAKPAYTPYASAPVEKPKQDAATPSAATPSYGGIVGDLVKTSKEGSPTVQRAIDQLVGFRRNAANYRADIYSAPTSARVMQGRDEAVQLANAQTDAALASGVSAATQAQGQQLTALGAAAGYAAPVQVAPGSTLASPVSGGTVAGGLGGYANYQTAEQVMGLIRQYPDAQYVYDQTKTPQENLSTFQSHALQSSPTYQKSTYGVPGAQTVADATAIQAAQQGYTQAVQQYQTMNTALTNADGQASLLLQSLKSSGINSSDARFANKTVNEVRRQLSSSDLQVFDSALKETQAAYGQLLVGGGGTTPTGAESAYNVILNPNASLSAFEAAITQLRRAGQTKVGAQGEQVNTYFGQLQNQQQAGQPGAAGGNAFATEW